MSELDRLRAHLDVLDEQLVELLAERMRIVAQVHAAKRDSDKPLFDRAREREVIARARAHAQQRGVSQGLVEAVMSAVLEDSHGLQAELGAEEHGETGRRFVILGGRGRMGRLFTRLLESRGHTVSAIDLGDALEPDAIAEADVVMVAVPMTEAEEMVRRAGPLVRSDALLCDINSLKSGVCRAMAEHAGGEALGMHPMFGPTVQSLRRQKVVLCPVKPGPMASWLEAELGRMGAELVHTDAATHDEMMAVVQVLTHFGILVMGRALSQSGVELARTLPFMSPIYRLELVMVGRLFAQDPELYGEILMGNPAGGRVRELLVQQATELARLLEQGDRQGFAKAFREAGGYFEELSGEAMELSDRIIETIMSHP